MKFKNLLSICLIGMFLVVMSFPVLADDPTQGRRTKTLEERITKLESDIREMDKKNKALLADLSNIEHLVIEFADELALLNVKVSTLEDSQK